MEEVRHSIRNLKKGKAPGNDGVTSEMIQAGGDSSVKIYHTLCCKIWKSGTWPEEWKRSVYIPLPKKGDLQLCTNYRTVALISQVRKILPQIIMKRIQRKLDTEIHEVQAGFRAGRGTRDHIFNMRNIIEKCREYSLDLHVFHRLHQGV